MIDKRTLNNEIVLMRRVVKQAKVHIINKLSREIKQLRQKDGPEDAKAKYNEKADRKRDEIFSIKKLNMDDVSKFALKNCKDPLKMLGDLGVSLEMKAFYRFAACKVVSARVSVFREQYPDWKDSIHELLDELGARRKNIPKQSPITGKPMNSSHNRTVDEKDSDVKRKETPLKSFEKSVKLRAEDDPNDDVNRKSYQTKTSEIPVKRSKFLSQWTVEEMKPAVDELVDAPPNQKVFKKIKGYQNEKHGKCSKDIGAGKFSYEFSGVNKSSGVAEVKRFHELCESNDSTECETRKHLLEDEDDEEGETAADDQAVDPFFVKSDGKTQYVTKMVVEEEGEEREGNSVPFTNNGWRSKRGQDPRRERGWALRGRGFGGSQRGPSSQRGGGGGKQWSPQDREGHGLKGSRFLGKNEFSKGRKSQFSEKNRSTAAESSHTLHPSWEAKKKLQAQSISTVAFQGKKIKFDDDD